MNPNSVIAEDCSEIVLRLESQLQALAGGCILITGAGGFLCSHLVDVIAYWNRAASNPCRVIAVDNYVVGSSGRLDHLADDEHVTLVNANVVEPLQLKERPQWVVHGATIASPIYYRKLPLETLDANVGGTRNILEMARQNGDTRGVLILSSSEIYGDPVPESIPTPETYLGNVSCVGPRACYDESKRVSETLAWIYHEHYAVPTKIVRPFNVYGPGQRLDDGRIVPDLMKAALSGEPIELFSDGRATRAYCYAADAIEGLLRVLLASDNGGEVYNIGNDETELSVSDVAQVMVDVARDVCGTELDVRMAQHEDRHYVTNNPQRRCPNLDKARSSLGYEPRIGVRDGLARTLSSYMNGSQ